MAFTTPAGDDVIGRARQLVVDGQYLEAAAGLTAHLDAHPDDALAWRRLAGALVGAGEMPRAIAAADRAIALAPDEPVAYRFRALANLELKNYAEMHADAERGLALAGDDVEALTLAVYGALLFERDVPRAKALWQRAHASDANHPAVVRLRRILWSGRWRALLRAVALSAYAAVVALFLGIAALEPERPWMLVPAALLAVFVIVAIPVLRMKRPAQLPGPGDLAAAVVGASLVVGACTFAATRSLLPALAIELVTAVLGAVLSIRPVLLWARSRRAAGHTTPI